MRYRIVAAAVAGVGMLGAAAACRSRKSTKPKPSEAGPQATFAGPYYVTGQQLMVRKDDSGINGPDDLAGKKVCSVTGSTPLATIQSKYKSAVAVPFATYTECVQQLINKSVDAVTTDGAILLG